MKKIYTIAILCLMALGAFAQSTNIYEYDNLNRLTKVTYANGAVVQYTYDAVGNRTKKQVSGVNNQYNITAIANPSNGGTINGAGTYEVGSNCTLTATANSGYTFTNWTESGNVVSTNASYSFTVTGNRTLVANFTAIGLMTTLSDDFNDGVINPAYWTATGNNVYEVDGLMKLQQNKTDDNVSLESVSLAVPANNQIVIDRSFLIHEKTYSSSYGSHFFYGSVTVKLNGSDDSFVGISYYDDDYENRHGVYLRVRLNGVLNETRICDATFDTWLTEKIVINISAETFAYYLDNTLVSTLSVSGLSSQQMDHYTVIFKPYGWWTGHYHNMDYINISTEIPVSYDIQVTANPSNGGAVSGGGAYLNGAGCTLTATPNEGYTFVNWTENDEIVSTETTYTFTVTCNRSLVANFEANGGGSDHEYVDLGLPSGLLWATCNVGADNPEDYGDYFAWGETQPKDTYDWNTYQYCMGSSNTLTKYCSNSSKGYNGFTDNLTTLLPEDDAATTNWGDDWRMPTKEEFEELYNNTTFTWTTQNGVNGRLFTATNGNSLFLPAAGFRGYSSLYNAGSYGYYWSSLLDADAPGSAWDFNFGSIDYRMYYDFRCYGLSVRPVRSGQDIAININAVANPAEGGTVEGGGTYNQGAECTLTATANSGYTFVNWTENDEVVSTEAIYTFTVTCDRTLVANFTQNGGGGGDHEYVDLGLPSGLLWATCNVGADNPEDYGDYFAWGETQPKDNYDWSTYQYCMGSDNTLTKYCSNSSNGYNGFTDNLTTLLPEDDAATANWGDDWRMPTKEEFEELYNNTTVTWTTQNGVNGRLFTATNGNSLFLPAAGFRSGYLLNNVWSNGYYWSSLLNTAHSTVACRFSFNSDGYNMSNGILRIYGHSVRPVRSGQPQQTTQTTSLTTGWNWYSTYIEQNGSDGLTQLENSLSSNGTMIKSQTLSVDNFYSWMGYDYWYGELASLTNEQSYMINTTSSCNVAMTGTAANPSEHPITIQPNWNWIGYPVPVAQTIETAMATFEETQDDVIKSQGESSIYYEGYGWWPSINMVPGTGYLYQSNATVNKTLVYDVDVTRDGTALYNAPEKYLSTDVHAFADNLTIIATVTVGDEEVRSGDIELGAFVNGVNRGSAVLRYFEPLNRYYAVLTVTGEDDDIIDFGIVDRTTGMTNFRSDNHFTFEANAVIGTLNAPSLISFDADGTHWSSLAMFPNPVSRDAEITLMLPDSETIKEVAVTNVLGERVVLGSINGTTLPGFKTSGIYMVEVICESGNVYLNKLIVK